MPNLEDILPVKVEPQQMDPVSDIMAATKGIPIAAFPGQNHEAHIATKMAYLQDPKNGANPIMQRISPILEANIQEHSVMQYQEQVNGVAQEAIKQLPPEQQQNPSVLEMVMAQAAQQVMNANQAAGIAQSPEQQLVALEQAKVELQKQKLQADTAIQAAELELKTKQLELDENEQIISMLESGATDNFKKEKAELDRESRKELKTMDVLSKVAIEEEKQMNENKRLVATAAKDLMEKGE
tara:strand:- start:47 stop:766 length:720 start_codon:yes stop_codon:yes gene_type:complete